MTDGRTRVYFTVDVECAEERLGPEGIRPPLGWDERVFGRFANQREELGIDLIMRELDSCGLKGTFFLEALGAAYFGEEGLRDVVQALRGRGHDVQLHTHPVQRRADFRSRGEKGAPDNIADYPVEEQTALLREGLDALVRCGVPREELNSFRAGNFGASNDTWLAMAKAGLTLSSNFNLCYLTKNCKIRWPHAENALFDTGVGVWELPISNFTEPGGGYRHTQITAVSFAEMRAFLFEARRLGLPEVTLVTHSFEYFWVDSPAKKLGRVNRVNRSRLHRLCAFLRDHRHLFEVETVGALARRLPPAPAGRIDQHPVPRGKARYRFGRLLEQAYKRVEARLPF